MADSQGLAARQVAVQVLDAVDKDEAFSVLSLHAILSRRHLDEPDRSFATYLAYGVLRWRGRLDWELQGLLRQPAERLPATVRNILRLGLFQLRLADSVPAAAAVNTSAELARRAGYPGLVRLVNGVLRQASRTDRAELLRPWPDRRQDPAGYLAAAGSHPRWLVERWIARLGFDEAAALVQANNQPPPITVRVNPLRISPPELLRRWQARGLEAEPSPLVPEGIRVRAFPGLEQSAEYRQGLFQVQDESSMLVGYAVAPAAGQTVLDLCSAPGGKTTHLAQLLAGSGQVLAFDPNPRKLGLVQAAAVRLGLANVRTRCADARQVRTSPALRVLVDAPCSGLGVIRRRPELRWRQRPEHIPALVELQREILAAAARLVLPGGRLVYSTCTTEPEENEENVAWFGEQYPCFEPDPILPRLPPAARRALTDAATQNPYVRLWPHRQGCDGFFIAAWQRR